MTTCGNCGHPSPGHQGNCWYEIDGPGPGPKPTNPHDVPCPHGDDVGCCLVCTPPLGRLAAAEADRDYQQARAEEAEELLGETTAALTRANNLLTGQNPT
jgi:hypothetical protein